MDQLLRRMSLNQNNKSLNLIKINLNQSNKNWNQSNKNPEPEQQELEPEQQSELETKKANDIQLLSKNHFLLYFLL